MSDILNKILDTKHAEVIASMEQVPLVLMRQEAEQAGPPRDFTGAIRA